MEFSVGECVARLNEKEAAEAAETDISLEEFSNTAEDRQQLIQTRPLRGIRRPTLSFLTKMAFGIGGIPIAITSTLMGFFSSPFLLEVAKLQPSYVSCILLIARCWDGISDPTMGYLISITKTRYGRFRLWSVISIPICVITYFCFWLVPPGNSTQLFVYYLIIVIIYQAGYTGYQVPITALTMHISDEPRLRDSAITYRLAMEVLAVLISTIVQGYLVQSNLTDLRKGFWESSLIMAIICLVSALFCLYFIQEHKERATNHMSFFQGFRYVIKAQSYIQLLNPVLWVWMALAIVQNVYILYLTHVLNRANQFAFFLGVMMISCFICMPVYFYTMDKIGKKATFLIGMAVTIPSLFVFYVIPANAPLGWHLLHQFFIGIGIGSIYLLPYAMLPDAIDDIEVKTHHRFEELFYSYFVFFQKTCTGVALFISTLVLQSAGYDSNLTTQPPSVSKCLRTMMGVAALILCGFTVITIYWYPISRRKAVENKLELSNRRHELEMTENLLEQQHQH